MDWIPQQEGPVRPQVEARHSDSSSSYSMSSSDSDEEQSDSGAVPPAPISIRFDEEEEEEEEVISGLDKLLLSHHNEDQDMDFMDVSPSLDTVQEDTLTATPSVASVQEPEEQ